MIYEDFYDTCIGDGEVDQVHHVATTPGTTRAELQAFMREHPQYVDDALLGCDPGHFDSRVRAISLRFGKAYWSIAKEAYQAQPIHPLPDTCLDEGVKIKMGHLRENMGYFYPHGHSLFTWEEVDVNQFPKRLRRRVRRMRREHRKWLNVCGVAP